jgi:hypothetical protein
MSTKLLDTANMMRRSSVRMMAGVLGLKTPFSVLDLIEAAANDPFDRCSSLEGQLNVLRQQYADLGDRLIQGPHDPHPGKPDPSGKPDPLLEKKYRAKAREIAAKEREIEACRADAEPVSQVVPNDFPIYTSAMRENTVQVATPHRDCPNGRIILHTGESRSTCGFVLRDLFDSSGAILASAVAPAPPAIAYPFESDQTNATDNQIIRLQDGSLLASKNGYTWSDLSPKPKWFGLFDVVFSGRSGDQTSQRARNAVFIFHSSDRGLTWKQISRIDAAKVAGGEYGWPQFKMKDDGLVHIGVGAFDRTELYQDPWTGHVYVAGHGDAGPDSDERSQQQAMLPDGTLHEAHASAIFRSKDNGQTWEDPPLHVFPDPGDGWTSFMTSTPNHPLVALRGDGDAPTLWYLKKGSESLAGGKEIVAKSGGDLLHQGTLIDDDFTPMAGGLRRIARMSWDGARDRVWVAYPNIDASGERQRYVLCSVEFGGSNPPKVELIRIIEAEDPSGSCTHGAFVQDDRVEWNRSVSKNFTMFYWLERRLDAKHPAIMRYKVMYGDGEELHAKDLSVAGGAQRQFNMAALGHYMSGGFYYWGGAPNFLAQWVGSDGIKGNVVSVRPRKP